MREKIIEILKNLRWGEYQSEEIIADQILALIIECLPERIEIYPDIKDGKWGDFRDNISWTDGLTMAKMQEEIIPTLFWKNGLNEEKRDRLYVEFPKEQLITTLSQKGIK